MLKFISIFTSVIYIRSVIVNGVNILKIILENYEKKNSSLFVYHQFRAFCHYLYQLVKKKIYTVRTKIINKSFFTVV